MWWPSTMLLLALQFNFPTLLDEPCVFDKTATNATVHTLLTEWERYDLGFLQSDFTSGPTAGDSDQVTTTRDNPAKWPIVVFISHEPFEQLTDNAEQEQPLGVNICPLDTCPVDAINSTGWAEKDDADSAHQGKEDEKEPDIVVPAQTADHFSDWRRDYETLNKSLVVKTLVVLMFVLQGIVVWVLTTGAYGKKTEIVKRNAGKRANAKGKNHRRKVKSSKRRH